MGSGICNPASASHWSLVHLGKDMTLGKAVSLSCRQCLVRAPAVSHQQAIKSAARGWVLQLPEGIWAEDHDFYYKVSCNKKISTQGAITLQCNY